MQVHFFFHFQKRKWISHYEFHFFFWKWKNKIKIAKFNCIHHSFSDSIFFPNAVIFFFQWNTVLFFIGKHRHFFFHVIFLFQPDICKEKFVFLHMNNWKKSQECQKPNSTRERRHFFHKLWLPTHPHTKKYFHAFGKG